MLAKALVENLLLKLKFFPRMALIGAEQILGMADMKDLTQPIVIQTTNTESLSLSDPAPGPVSTLTDPLTDPHPGQ